MQLTTRDVARLLQVTERTVVGWVRNDGLPVTRLNDQLRFNRSELLEWATAHSVSMPPDLIQQDSPSAVISISDALALGGIHYGLQGTDKASVLREIVECIPFPQDSDRELFLRVLLAREEMGSTGIGAGIAIPHVRNPVVLRVKEPIVTLCFLDKPVDFGAVDDKPVHCFFTLVTPNVRTHLSVISRLAFILHDSRVSDVVQRHALKREIVAEIARAEGGLSA